MERETAFAPGHMTPTFGEPSAGGAKAPATTSAKATPATPTAQSAAAAPAQQAAAASPSHGPAAPAGAYVYTASQGESLFNGTCAACHQTTGEGIPGVFPPLKGNAAVADADPGTQIDTILRGRHGTVIGGQKYSGVMPAFASQFSDVQIADIANYERTSWGNHGKQVTPEEVAALRAKLK
ncbi:MAG TPA: cytochrome c [Nevskiaceae bacterium]